MTLNEQIAAHYRHGDLLQAIEDGLSNLGLGPNRVTVDDLGPVDEFHIGGRVASTHFLDQLDINAGMTVLDVGCGLGGG
ncbi:MAG TPA: SAM-dependent methyltransferase, partial [Hyphomonas sp.]|nr:SAM-dependent methyltransferase [Hyphomonas sp.]